jgi:hypothetical protein
MIDDVFTISLLGASDVQDRNCRDWPLLMAKYLQVGKSSRIRTMAFGYEGQGSTTWLSDGHAARIAGQRADVALLSFFADGSVPLCADPATNLANMYTFIDAIQAKRADTEIFLIRNWRMTAAREAATFSQLQDVYYTNYPIVQANRSNISILDFYVVSGLPSAHPDEWNVSDDIHPLLPWHQRVSIPMTAAALSPLVD